MLAELCKRDKDWRRMALQICGDKMLADDLVQDMYLKFSDYNKEMNEFYVFFAIKGIFLNGIKKRKLDVLDVEIEKVTIFEDTYCFETDNFETQIINQVDTFPYFERELLKATQLISQRELARQTDISLSTIKKTVKETKTELKLWAEKRR